MQTKCLDGETLVRLLRGGAEGIRENKDTINELNVFPVPDGDTGTNMMRTVESGVDKLIGEEATVGTLAAEFAKGTLLGARGNSGVILSQFISGVCSALSGSETVSARQLAEAGLEGVRRAYAAVANPTEGTMLTVFRESVDYALKNLKEEDGIEELLRLHIEEARRSLVKTKELLPVLAEADVVDSGGAGYLCILIGMYDALMGKVSAVHFESRAAEASEQVDYSLFTADSELTYGYCTECLVRLQTAKGDPESFDREAFLTALTAMGGDSVVLIRDGDVLKLHVHIKSPGDVLALCQKYGEFLQVKIENMSLGHSGETTPVKKPERRKKYAAVAVSGGDGMTALFEELGVSAVVDGGQTANPSTEDFLTAFASVNAEHIFVLPNNSNIILTAEQAAALHEDATVIVVPTRTLAEGYAALSVFNEGADTPEDILSDMTDAVGAVTTCEVSLAVRDATVDGVSVKAGENIGIVDGKLTVSKETETEALIATVSAVETLDETELLTLFVGEGVSEAERVAATEALEEAFPDLETTVYIGGQRVYRYLVSLE